MRKSGILIFIGFLIGFCPCFHINTCAINTRHCCYFQSDKDVFLSELQYVVKNYSYMGYEEILSRLKEAERVFRKIDVNSRARCCEVFLNVLRMVKEKLMYSDESKFEYEKLHSKMQYRILSCSNSCLIAPSAPKIRPQQCCFVIDEWDMRTKIPE